MTRIIIISILLVIGVMGAGQYLTRQAESQRILKSQLRQLPGNQGITGDSVKVLKIESADTAWTYRFKGGNWHYPADENAFALNDRIKAFVKDVVETYGTIVDTQVKPKFGFDSTALKVHLTDSTGTWQQTVSIGTSLPGTDTREAYMKHPTSDTIYHIHADPRRGLQWQRLPNRPPFIDPKILPSALSRRAIKRFVFKGHSLQELDRVEIEQDEDESSPTDGPTYEWYSVRSGKRQKRVNGSIYAYISYLSRLKFEALHDPAQISQTNKYIVLIDDQDTADTLDIAPHTTNTTYVHHRTTGHLYSITNTKANLLFPTATNLDSLPDPSPYQLAEPTGAFSLATP
ncbi:MAG: DUF4340 domain-containing protein [Candidatus Latescibacteria bacterium]|nr:DUF4340 domain-containing protein [Candidatus Latescibacterota bacterium]